ALLQRQGQRDPDQRPALSGAQAEAAGRGPGSAQREEPRPGRAGLAGEGLTRAYGRAAAIFQNAMPPACCPTSTEATRASAPRSQTSTVPGAAPTPSLLMKA